MKKTSDKVFRTLKMLRDKKVKKLNKKIHNIWFNKWTIKSNELLYGSLLVYFNNYDLFPNCSLTIKNKSIKIVCDLKKTKIQWRRELISFDDTKLISEIHSMFCNADCDIYNYKIKNHDNCKDKSTFEFIILSMDN